jgi:LysM repeat protein
MRLLAKLFLCSILAVLLSAARPALAGTGARQSLSNDLAQGAVIHIVQPGEDLYRIGLAYGINWQAIMAANGLYSTVIYVGESLVIPVASAEPDPAAPAATAEPAPEPAATAPASAPASADGSYMIQRGDTLWLVARRFGLTVGQLMASNNIRNPNYIYYGQVLVIPGQAAPAEGKVLSVAGQAQALPLDCESRSAVDWAAYFGASIGELDFLSRLPESDDPDIGFVGNAHGALGQTPPNDYGVHAGPVAAVLRAYGVGAHAARGLSWDDVRAEIDADRPVMVWVVSQVGYGTPVEYTAASTGHTTTVVPYEHTVLVIGYGVDSVTVLDGATTYTRPLAQFMASWGALGDMAILWGSA